VTKAQAMLAILQRVRKSTMFLLSAYPYGKRKKSTVHP